MHEGERHRNSSLELSSTSLVQNSSSLDWSWLKPMENNTTIIYNAQQRFCELGTVRGHIFDGCYKLLFPYFENIRNRPMEPHHWLVLGDSTMNLVVTKAQSCAFFTRGYPYRCSQCSYLTSTASPNIKDWKRPNVTRGEGPVMYGLENPTCTDCSSCRIRTFIKVPLVTSAAADEAAKEYPHEGDFKLSFSSQMRFFPVEFARDVIMQCPTVGTRTTQETLVYHLQNKFPPQIYANRTTCLLSAGFHDMAIVPEISAQTFVQNVKEYIGQIRPFCKRMIWIGLNTVRDERNYAQRNYKVVKWNKGVKTMLERDFPNDVFFVGVARRTQNMMEHADNIHMDWGYYHSLAWFFFQNLTRFCEQL